MVIWRIQEGTGNRKWYDSQKSPRSISPHFSHCARRHFVLAYSVPLHSVHFTGTLLLWQAVSDSQDICTRTLSQMSWLTDPIFRINAHKTLHRNLHRDLSSGQSGVGRPLFSLRRLRFGHRTADQCPAIATFRMLHTCDDRTLFLIDEPKALLSLCDRSDSGSH